MILPASHIRQELEHGSIAFDPAVDDAAFQSASVDLRLGPVLRIPAPREHIILSPRFALPLAEYGNLTEIPAGGYNLQRGEFVLGSTLETVTIPPHLAGRLEGKSSLARLGLLIHFTSAHIAPGFSGTIVLEIVNLGPNRVALTPGMRICQLIFEQLVEPADTPYAGTYQGQRQP